MTDFISREDALNHIREYIDEYGEWTDENGWHSDKWCAMKEAERVLEKLPAADVRPNVTGRWEVFHNDDAPYYERKEWIVCSACKRKALGSRLHDEVRSNFCPWCGAKMEEAEK